MIKSNTFSLVKNRSLTALLGAALLVGSARTSMGESVNTVPVGAVTLTITAGTGTTRTNSVLSVPLLDTAAAEGQMTGRITAFTANSIQNSNAGWLAGSLSIAETPYLIRITSGSASGRTFLISTSTANTTTSLFIDPADAAQVDLLSLGVVAGPAGDTYEIIPADTLVNLFGNPDSSGVLGGNTAAEADLIYVNVNGGWNQYFYKIGVGWVRNSLGNPSAANLVIRPDAGLIYSRLGDSVLRFNIFGRVPMLGRKMEIPNSGVSFISSGWPVDSKLSDLKIQNIPGWIAAPTFEASDSVSLFVDGGWRHYWFDGVNWRRNSLGVPLSDNQVIAVGSAVMITRKNSIAGSDVLVQPLPYSI